MVIATGLISKMLKYLHIYQCLFLILFCNAIKKNNLKKIFCWEKLNINSWSLRVKDGAPAHHILTSRRYSIISFGRSMRDREFRTTPSSLFFGLLSAFIIHLKHIILSCLDFYGFGKGSLKKKVLLFMAGQLRPNPPPPSSLVAVEILASRKKRSHKKKFFF